MTCKTCDEQRKKFWAEIEAQHYGKASRSALYGVKMMLTKQYDKMRGKESKDD